MKLTREQRAELFAGEAPRIAGEGNCPWKPGDVYRASAKLTLTVVAIRDVKPRWSNGKWTKPGWSLKYEVMDTRDAPRLLRPTPRPVDFEQMRKDRDPYGFPKGDPDDPQVLRQAAIESAYTSSRGAAVDGADEGVKDPVLDQFADEARQRLKRERRQDYDRKMARSRAATLKEVELRARYRGVDVSGELAHIDDKLAEMRRKVDDNGEKAA